jgi:hypothetical protein
LKWLFRANWAGVDDSDPVAMRAFVQACRERDKRVGALLRELHYLCTSKPPHGLADNDEEAYWTGVAEGRPGLDEERVRAELARRRAQAAEKTQLEGHDREYPVQDEVIGQFDPTAPGYVGMYTPPPPYPAPRLVAGAPSTSPPDEA